MHQSSEPKLKLRAGDVVWRAFKEEGIALDLRSSTYMSTNASASVLWRELERGTTRSELVDTLLSEFDVERARAEADVDGFVQECNRRELLETAEPPTR